MTLRYLYHLLGLDGFVDIHLPLEYDYIIKVRPEKAAEIQSYVDSIDWYDLEGQGIGAEEPLERYKDDIALLIDWTHILWNNTSGEAEPERILFTEDILSYFDNFEDWDWEDTKYLVKLNEIAKELESIGCF